LPELKGTDWPSFAGRWGRKTSSVERTAACSWRIPRCAAGLPRRTPALSSPPARRPSVWAIAATRRTCGWCFENCWGGKGPGISTVVRL